MAIGFGDLEVEHGLALGLVFGFDELPGFVLVGGLEAGALAGGFVHAVKHSSTVSAVGQTVTGCHGKHATARIIKAVPGNLASSVREFAGYAKF